MVNTWGNSQQEEKQREEKEVRQKTCADVVLLHIIHYISEHIHKKQQPYRHCSSSLH